MSERPLSRVPGLTESFVTGLSKISVYTCAQLAITSPVTIMEACDVPFAEAEVSTTTDHSSEQGHRK